jgi:uncharacterized protein DUF3800
MSTEPTPATTHTPPLRHFFVDEAGDPVVFGKRRKIVVGTEGCSKFFMLGMAYIQDPEETFRKIEELRAELLAHPYFRDVPSMQPAAKKTAVCFHATDDVPEVRWEVFKLLPQLNVKVRVAVWDKLAFASGFQKHANLKFGANDIYDSLVKELFHNQLHEAEANTITFARRGKSARIEALANAITQAKEIFRKHYGGAEDRPCKVLAAHPSECVGLQVIDYYLWACQRWFERSEDRFYRLVEGQIEPALGDPSKAQPKPDPLLKEIRTIEVKEVTKKERPSSELGTDL